MPLLTIPQKWDGEADVIVIGAGTAGLPAAIVAKEKGAEVMVLEAWSGPASSLAFIAGGTPFAGTDFQKARGIDDSSENLYKNAVEVSGGSPELWRTIADNQMDTYHWLTGLGAKPIELWTGGKHDKVRIHRWEGHGAGVLRILKETAEKRNIRLLYKHRAEIFILDPATSRVIGVRANHDGKAFYFRARGGVVLTTGGFIRNKEMVKEYGPHYVNCIPVAPLTHMGDGLKMALDVGAATEGLGLAVSPSISVCTETNRTTVMRAQGAICVNKDGERWADELGQPYNKVFGDLLRQQPDGLHFLVYDSKIRKDASPEDYSHVKEFKADTISEVASAAGLPPDGLTSTINSYNSNIAQHGYDTEYGRKWWGGALHAIEPPPQIDTPPFYAIRCKVSLSSLKGGIKINTRTQVINQFGQVIPGLYAAGEVTGGLVGKPLLYYTGAMTLMCFVLGRIAGGNAAAEAANSKR